VILHIDKQGELLNIRIEGLAGRQQDLLETIRRCRPSAWACPSGECRNIEAMNARAEGEAICLRLTPRPGTQLDASGIEECLRYLAHLR